MIGQARHIALAIGAVVATAVACLGQPTPADQQATEIARSRLREQVLAIQVQPGVSAGDVLRRNGQMPDFDKQITAIRPVGGVRWIGDRGCQVRLEMPGDQIASLLRKGGDYQTTQPAGDVADRLTRIEQTLYVSEASSASGADRTASSGTGERKLVPQQAPEWVNRSLETQSWVRSAGSPLLTAQAAEEKARQSLRERVGLLSLAYQTNVGQASKLDPDIQAAVERAMGMARVKRTDYGSDGSATVRVELNLQYLWDELNR
jgi:hypothetical protein